MNFSDSEYVELISDSINGNSAIQDLRSRMRHEERSLKKAQKFLEKQRECLQHEDFDVLPIPPLKNPKRYEQNWTSNDQQNLEAADFAIEHDIQQSPNRNTYNLATSSPEKWANPLSDGIKDLDSKQNSLEKIEKDLDTLLNSLKNKTHGAHVIAHIPTYNGPKIPRSTHVSDSLDPNIFKDKLYSSHPKKFEKRRANEWSISQKRSEALMSEHQEWLSRFTATQKGII